MGKTVFSAGDQALGVKGTKVTAAFLNALQNHDHSGADADGHCPQIPNSNVVGGAIPTGTVIHVATAAAPAGWLACDGSAVSRVTYADLYTALGGAASPFGQGNGATTFNLPDLRGEFIRGLDSGRGVDAGRTRGSFQGDQNKSHTHNYNNNGLANQVNAGISGIYSVHEDAAATTTDGTNCGTESRPRNIALLACIKA